MTLRLSHIVQLASEHVIKKILKCRVCNIWPKHLREKPGVFAKEASYHPLTLLTLQPEYTWYVWYRLVELSKRKPVNA